MSQLSTLTASEQKKFGRPRALNNDERLLFFNITPDIKSTLSRIREPNNRVGFLLQLGSLRANGRFYASDIFNAQDISHVKRVLGLTSFNPAEYVETVPRRHRQRILALLGWQSIDASARSALTAHALNYTHNQEYPKKILRALVDLCWKRQWIIPKYHELNKIITDCYNNSERDSISSLEESLTAAQRDYLDTLLTPITNDTALGDPLPLTHLKKIDQSLRAKKVRGSMQTLRLFRDHFHSVEGALDVLEPSDKATKYLANWMELADHQQLTQFPNSHKIYLHLIAFIKHQFYQRQDHAIDIFLKSVTSISNTARNNVTKLDQAQKSDRAIAVQALHKAQMTASNFANGVIAISRSDDAGASEKYYKIESLIEDYMAQVNDLDMSRVDDLAKEVENDLKNTSFYEILTTLSSKLQGRVASIVRTVGFDAESSNANLMRAISHFQVKDGRIGKSPPSQFLSQEQHDAVFKDNEFNPRLYKALLFIHMSKGIKSGQLNVLHSYRFRSIQDYLIPPEEWKANKEKILRETDLAEFEDIQDVLNSLKERLSERYKLVNNNILAGNNNYMAVTNDGKCRVRTPKTDYDTHSFISSTLAQGGIIPILQVLKSVDSASRFTREFKHFSNKRSKMKPSAETLMAGVIAQGCNIGLGKLAKISTGIDDDSLRNTVNWFFNQDNLRAANLRITSLIGELALANNAISQPHKLHSSSDGRKVTVSVDCLHANRSFKYFGNDIGVTDYTFIDEREILFHNTLFSSSDREAPYVIDGLMDNQEKREHIHSTDTHGFSEQIFCASHLMGISFAPRIANLGKQQLYAFSSRRTLQKKGYPLLPSRTINQKIIISQWDDVLRFMATIKSRRATASQLFKRLSSYAVDHPLYRAMKEYGRIIKSDFVLTYYDDMELRQRIEMQLNKVEQANKFSAAVFFDNDHSFQDGELEQQKVASMCKLLLQNAIILWNYLSLSDKLVNTQDVDERQEAIEAIRRGSVLTWSHVNMRGEYTFTPPSANDDVFNLRKIRALQIVKQ